MKMTDEQRYSAVMKELGEALQGKNTTISCLRFQIDELKAKLKSLEVECERLAVERDKAVCNAKELDKKLQAAYVAIDDLKGGAA